MSTSALRVQDIEPVNTGSPGVFPVGGKSPLSELQLDQYLPNSIGVKPRYEIIDGVIYLMASPRFWHQRVSADMYVQLKQQLAPHGCEVMLAPFDVYLFWEEGDEKNYVEPDLFVTCDQEQIKRLKASEQDYYHGAPKFIVEILSPSNGAHDLVLKAELYYRAGVAEYWTVDTIDRTVHIFTLPEHGAKYQVTIVEAKGTIPLATFPGCVVDFNAIFQDEKKE
jgi:Uma2 family endonuclease